MIIKQISAFVENRPGRLAEIAAILADGGINIRALSVADTSNFGILRIIADDPYKAERLLRDNKVTVSVTSVISVCISDRPGGLAEVLKLLSDAGIQVEYMYAFISKNDDEASVVMRIEDEFTALNLLKENGFRGLCEL